MKIISLLFLAILMVTYIAGQNSYLVNTFFDSEEEIIGNSYYDLQSNGACQNRMYYYPDGTIGAVWTFGLDFPNFPDRGTGYNYFDGNNWNTWPEERIESDRTGWPSYAPLGENGEIIFSHYSGADIDGLSFCKRPQKGTGDWQENIFHGPPGHEGLVWPRMVTGGQNNNIIYLIAITRPEANGGLPYHGIDGALLYSMSTNGGLTWDHENVLFPELDSSFYKSIVGDSYAWAEPKDNVIAFVAGSCDHDLFLMKSTNYGETFEKTIIWDHPYDNGYQIIPEDTFYCVDGSMATAIDPLGKVHVAFGISKTWHDEGYEFYSLYWMVDGLGYWNEDRPTFSTNKNALNPYGHPDSELILNESLIGWCQDVNGDSVVTLLDDWGRYRGHGMSTMPQIVIDDQNRVFVIYTSVTETFDNGCQNYRHIWIRSSLDGGNSWEQFYHYAAYDPIHIFSEFSYPSCAANSDENIYILFQEDNEPGLLNDGPYGENFYYFAKIPKDEIVGIKENEKQIAEIVVSQNFPNPFSEMSTVRVNLRKQADLSLEVFSLLGQKVYEIKVANAKVGLNTLTIKAKGLSPGIYFYSVKAGGSSVTKKMIVE